MNQLPRDIADLCGIVVETTIEEEPVQSFFRYYVRQLTLVEYEVGFEKDGVKTPIGFIHRNGDNYRAVATNGTLGHCRSKKEAVEFIHASTY